MGGYHLEIPAKKEERESGRKLAKEEKAIIPKSSPAPKRKRKRKRKRRRRGRKLRLVN